MSPPTIILSINAGSSSLKVSVYKTTASETSSSVPQKDPTSNEDVSPDPTQLAVCTIEGLTAPPVKVKYNRPSPSPEVEAKTIAKELPEGVKNQEDAFRAILDILLEDDGLREVKSKEDIRYAVHRIVHGGPLFEGPQVLDEEKLKKIEQLSDLAPLHNAPALTIVKALKSYLPATTEIACFDTSFHLSIPPANHTYAINQQIATHNHLRKYGFHGLSYAFIARSVANHLRKPLADLNIIALHLGSGASACAIKGGKSLDTTMGLTPLAGLPGATRSGDIDASLIFHYTHRAGRMSRSSTKNLHLTEAEEILNKQSGWKALTGTTDFGKISALAEASRKDEKGHAECKLAFDVFADRILGYVGNYYVKLGGRVDALVFAGGIGEKGAGLRRRVVDGVRCLGFRGLDEKRNAEVGDVDGVVVDIDDGAEGGHPVLVCRTDEQLEMARDCWRSVEA